MVPASVEVSSSGRVRPLVLLCGMTGAKDSQRELGCKKQ